MAPPLQYARGPHGHVAYQVIGEGPVVVPHWGLNLSVEGFWDLPAAVRALERLARNAQLVLIDPRPIGGSDRKDDDETWHDAFAEDVDTVLDDLGADQATLVGFAVSARLAWHYAYTRAARVAHCITINGTRGLIDVVPPATPTQFVEEALWGETQQMMSWAAPSALDDQAFCSWFERGGRQALGPTDAESRLEWMLSFDVTELLPQLATRCTLIHGRNSPTIPLQAGRDQLAVLPDASLIEVDAGDLFAFTSEMPHYTAAIEAAITGHEADDVDRVIMAVLFTDICDSTALAADVGDSAWRAMLDRHDHLCRVHVERHQGRVVKATGDGHLSTFPSPNHAVACARALGHALDDAGLASRAGVHFGEVEVRGDDIGGLAVNLAARVCGKADAREILVTEAVRLVTLGGAHAFEAAGVHELKGIPGSFALSRLA